MNDKSHAATPHVCKCGASFNNRRHLIEHVGICNPKWPRTSQDDEHAATPANATSSELELELSAGVPSSLDRNSLHADSHADSRPETVGDRLKRIYPEHYTRIITEMNRVDGPDRAAKMLSRYDINSNVLQCVFLWGNSQEGHRFWANLAKREES